ncbi:MAG: pilus assembly FimT family protein [Pyrinomonadaceae bacterium]
MKIEKVNSQSGVSLIEVLIVLVILAILISFAVAQFGNSKTNLQRQRIAREFKVYLERARFDSVKRRAVNTGDMAKITLNSSSSFTVNIDFDGNGTLGTTETRQVDFTQRSDAQILVSTTLVYPVTISFDQRGHVTAKDSSTPAQDISPVFTICSSGNCSGTSADTTVISISTTGTVAVLKTAPGSSPLPTPAITGTPPKLNCYVLLLNSNTNTPCSLY